MLFAYYQDYRDVVVVEFIFQAIFHVSFGTSMIA
jgi:hypothetical protein